MYCTKCGVKVNKSDSFCSNCGTSIISKEKNTKSDSSIIPGKEICPKCNGQKRHLYKNKKYSGTNVCLKCDCKAGECPVCKKKLITDKAQECGHCNSSWHENPPKSTISTYTHENKISQPPKIKCPKCRSINIIGGKKGFSGQQAVGGAILTGGIGVLAGTIGSNKVELSCLSCGNRFKPGEDLKSLQKKRKQMEEAQGSLLYWILVMIVIAIGTVIIVFIFNILGI